MLKINIVYYLQIRVISGLLSDRNEIFALQGCYATYIGKLDIQRTVRRDIFVQQKPTRCTISQLYIGKELYVFRADLLSIIRCLNTAFTATGICHTEILKWVKLLVCICIYIYIYIQSLN